MDIENKKPPGRVEVRGLPRNVELDSTNDSESKPSLISLQARLMIHRFGMLPDTAIAIAYLAFEHGRGAA